MPDAATVETPPDLRTKEGREWKAKQDAAAAAPKPVARVAKIMAPDDFAAAFFIQNASAVSARSGEPNPIHAMAETCWKAYRAYLIAVSGPFYEHTKAHDMDTTTQFISPPKLWTAYDIATGAAK